MNPVSVSVIMAAYNATATLEATVATVQAQTRSDIEIIVIDDKSSDGTLALARDLARQDTRIHVIESPLNGGPAAARNLGFAAASGDWIAVVDSDDEILPDRLDSMVRTGEQEDVDILFDNLFYIKDGHTGLYLADATAIAGRLSLKTYIESHRRSCAIPNLGFLKPVIRRKALTRAALAYDTSLKIGEDAMLVMSLMANGSQAVLLPQAYYRYHRHEGSISARQDVESVRSINASFDAFLSRHAGSLAPEESLAMQKLIEDNRARIDASVMVDGLCQLQVMRVGRMFARNPKLAKPVVREILSRAKRIVTG